MIQNELNKRSPLRILEKSTHGGIRGGGIGVIAARKGVGKTACLVHIATDQLFQKKHVIHVSFSSSTEHIVSWYEHIFNEISKLYELESSMNIHDEIIKNRIIMNFKQEGISLLQITKSIRLMIQEGNFSADIIIIDGYDFTKSTVEEIKKVKQFASTQGLSIWFSVTLKDEQFIFDEKGIPTILEKYINEIDIQINLIPKNDFIHLELIKDYDSYASCDMNLILDSQTLLIITESKT